MNNERWIFCPFCGAKTRARLLPDTVLRNFPLFCPKMQAGRASSTRKIIKSNFCQTPGRSADRPLKKHSTLRFYFQS
jgi:hypothetical protein